MAFWGVEVKPGKPYTHSYNPSHGRLRICQATLGSCDAATRTVVQCIVGNKKPIILCSLNPKLTEMCHLEIELEEVDEVLFSVLGQSSVHLSGYYLRPGSRGNAGEEDSESYGEDVGESDTDQDYEGSEDSYESDFIDDGDNEVPEDSDVSDSMDDGDVCSTPDHRKQDSEKHARKVKRQRRLKKKQQVDSSADKIADSPSKPAARRKRGSIFDSASEDEDFLAQSEEENLPTPVSLAKKTNGKVSEEIKPGNVTSNDEAKKRSKSDKKRKSDAINEDPASPMDVTEINGSSVPKQEAEIKKKSKKKKKTLEAEDGKHSNNIRTLEDGLVIEDLSAGNQDAKVASEGNKVYINYVGKLQDGKTVHSNGEEKPYKFKLGKFWQTPSAYLTIPCLGLPFRMHVLLTAGSEKVMRGWNLGITGMRIGEKRRLTIPPSLCNNGGKSVVELPKDSTIIYEVELVKVR
ncbi:peptidyl-prolyl cis-trans isomerase FKBP43 isoform X1 [Triticum aestivum]|uniref:peptidyl-prolyl cis-trans isomerase FKBP43 isoform X1 n=1 Tax=Triticum aestivum TaxID=4565 RepID=UPI001D034D30|nr:peptidyl-prolyl cis-trans isomerase FKBP43-like isoform X1 [Triticum aestivum]